MPVSANLSMQYEHTMAAQQQPPLAQQRQYHVANHNASHYVPPPRMRKGRGRGSSIAPQASVSRDYNLYNQAQQQPRIGKRNYNPNMNTSVPGQPTVSFAYR